MTSAGSGASRESRAMTRHSRQSECRSLDEKNKNIGVIEVYAPAGRETKLIRNQFTQLLHHNNSIVIGNLNSRHIVLSSSSTNVKGKLIKKCLDLDS